LVHSLTDETRRVVEMNRITKLGISALMAASVAAGAVGIAGSGVASASTKPSVVSACSVKATNYAYPRTATRYRAGTAGSVSVAGVTSATIRVASLQPAAGWRSFVDTSSGSSVDVYFSSGTHRVKFEAEINDWGGLTITVTSC
jgi:hypothetical protein